MDKLKKMATDGLIIFATAAVLIFMGIVNSHASVDKTVPKIPIEIYKLDGAWVSSMYKMEKLLEHIRKQHPEWFKENYNGTKTNP